ncbi:uncharacterized protein LOC132305263 [Cornus florida]|uniref:uncharacterized protein LOC132305263 n=1 Tax=Cornus florida TaxID=4283 RepID=UPI0028989455|nr:uncharacterized protein LOC132305263 [Cornus florida]
MVEIGEGSLSNFWFDNWSSLGPLHLLVTQQQLMQSGYDTKTKLSSFISGSNWTFSSSITVILPQLLPSSSLPTPVPQRKDRFIWIPSSSGKFTIVSTLKLINRDIPSQPWSHLVWSKVSIPKHSFTLWVAIQKRLPTLNRRCAAYLNTTTCLICNNDLESHNHLFFSCPYVKPLWTFLLAHCGFYILRSNWSELIHWAAHHWRGNNHSQCNSVSKLALSSLVYNVWNKRNRSLFKKKKLSANSLLHMTLEPVRLKLMSSTFIESIHTRRLTMEWDLPSCVFRPPPKPPD